MLPQDPVILTRARARMSPTTVLCGHIGNTGCPEENH